MRSLVSRIPSILVLACLLASSVSTVLFEELEASQPSSKVEGRVTVDFLVESIEFGNASVKPQNWTQPDKSVVEFLLRGDTMPIDITVYWDEDVGQIGQFTNVVVKVEAIHPIGYVEWDASYTEEMTSGMRNTTTVQWTPEATHSELINNELTGGYTLRVSLITGSFDTDQDETNDVMERMVPVALWRDELESGFTSGLTMQAYRYSKNTVDGPDAVARGIWQIEDGSGTIGEDSWRHSNPGSNYPSNAFDRMVWGFSTLNSCAANDEVQSVLEQGWDANGEYIWPYCRVQLDGSLFRSIDISTQAWGEVSSGDLVGLELWRPGGTGTQLVHEFENISSIEGQWTPITWRISEAEMNKLSWNVGFLFESDNTGASSGFHVDDFAIFGVELVNRFTLDVTCLDSVSDTFPELGYNVIPADPNPPGMICDVHNNGYRDASVRMKSMNTNSSWIEPRIDHSLGLTYGDDVSVVIPADGDATFWINQSIPPAAEVTDPSDITLWEVEIVGAFDGLLHYDHTLPVIVGYHDNVNLWPKDATFSFDIDPGQTQSADFWVRNTGNKHGTYEFTGIFPSERPEWLPWLAVSFSGENGSELTEIYLTKGEIYEFTMHLTAPDQTTPGVFEVEVQANGIRGTSAQAIYPIPISVDQDHDLVMTASTTSITSPVDGNQELIPVILRNFGNTLESFDLSLFGDAYPLRATLSTSQTTPLDPFGGESGVNVILPMHQTTEELLIEPGNYVLIVTAISTSNPNYKSELIIQVIITDTFAVSVSDLDLEGQSYRGGQPEDSIQFEVTNRGNTRDSFEIELEIPGGMNARVAGLGDDSITPEIEPGSSFNVTVTFDFDSLIDGDLPLIVSATSLADSNITASGNAVFTVGNLGWIKLLLSADESIELTTIESGSRYLVEVSESDEIPLTLQVFNKHYESQEVRIDFDDQISSGYYNLRIDELTSSFSIDGNDNRDISLELIVPRSSLLSLPSNEYIVNVTIWVESDLDVAPIDLQVKLIRSSVVEIEQEGSNVGGIIVDSLIYLALIGILGALVFALVNVARSGDDDDDDEYGSEYEPSLLSHYGEDGGAKSVPSATSFLDSMSDISEWEPPVKKDPDQLLEEEAPMPVIESNQHQPEQGIPPIPIDGLPDGWTMEQWKHYGQQWLDRSSED